MTYTSDHSAVCELTVDRRQMVLALASMIDLVGLDDTHHGKRVGIMASQLARHLGASEREADAIFELGLLHDCGVSTQSTHTNLVSHMFWSGANLHCEIGYELLRNFAPLANFANPIRFHHTPWPELQQAPISPRERWLANLIFLVDRADIMAPGHSAEALLRASDSICTTLTSYSGVYFDPVLINGFNQLATCEAFWMGLSDSHIIYAAWEHARTAMPQSLNLDQLLQLARIMGYIVDQKSSFTAQHSARVAAVARFLAHCRGLPPATCTKIEVAGLLHDIGKLHVPDEILDKPGPLDDNERIIMNQHSFETFEILHRIGGLDDIARWAAYHHDRPNGQGYPFHPSCQELSLEARIIAVADVFQALLQDRPYRAGMPLNRVLSHLDHARRLGELDSELVELLIQHADHCHDLALGVLPEARVKELSA